EIIRGIEVTAAEQGYLVLIGDCAHQNQKEKTFLNLIITKQIDATNGIRFNDLLATLNTLPARSIVLLHPCCHNPTGADLTPSQ
ncbi:aminotransferase class I/II-fold pyridoxal phosphate-dependent enzyme, partial [Salmonella enterica subsp. enterica serovar Muenster]|nr:aminotransferase class I/II-fold pyridoxal phosphate-dependent enzyme [Salmonella enterica subsp. enterica serovar Muenster]